MIRNLLQSFKKFLSKISVFHQIIFLIIIMIAFMVILSINSSKAMNIIQQNTSTIYDNTAGIKTQDSIDIEVEVEKIRNHYLSLLANQSTAVSSSKLNLNVLFNKIKARKNIDESTNKRLDESFARIKVIMEQPINSSNYTTLSQEIDNLQSALKYIRNTTSSINYNLYLDSERLAAKLKKSNIRLVFIGLICITLIGLIIAGSIFIPLKRIVKRVNSLEAGDLSHNITDVTGSHEATEAIKGLNKAIISLRSLVTNISKQSLTLDNTSAELSSISSATGTLATEVAKAANELASASSEQVQQITEAIKTIQELSDMVIQVTKDTQRISDSSSQIIKSAELGQKVTNDVAIEINSLFNSTQEVGEAVSILTTTSKEISGITSIIEGIAEQTSLLALNASIEAARAGEHGKGFAVVAREVGKLAVRAKQSVQSISELISEMKTHTEQSIELIWQGIMRAETGKNFTEKATTTFQEINKTLMNTIIEINSIVESTKQMSTLNEKATDAISAISVISEQNLASTEEVSAVTEEQSAAMEQVTALADHLRHIASDLKKSVETFDLG